MNVSVSLYELKEGLVDLRLFDVIFVADDGVAGGRTLGDRALKVIWRAQRAARHELIPEGVAVELGYLMINIDNTADPATLAAVRILVEQQLGEDAANGAFFPEV